MLTSVWLEPYECCFCCLVRDSSFAILPTQYTRFIDAMPRAIGTTFIFAFVVNKNNEKLRCI